LSGILSRWMGFDFFGRGFVRNPILKAAPTWMFASPASNLDKIARLAVRDRQHRNPDHQRHRQSHSNEVEIFVEGKGQDDAALKPARRSAERSKRYLWSFRIRFQFRDAASLAAVLTERSLLLSANAGDRTSRSPKNFSITATRIPTACSPISTSFPSRRRHCSGPCCREISYALNPFVIRGGATVGPKSAANSAAGNFSYPLCFRRHAGIYCLPIRVGLRAAAVLAVFHDVLITLGFSRCCASRFLSRLSRRFSHSSLLHERHDRHLRSHRENNRLLRKESFADVVNKSINQTLSRTILTSGLTFLTVLVCS